MTDEETDNQGPEEEIITPPREPKRLKEPVPIRVVLCFTAAAEIEDAEDVQAVYDAVCEEAERRGLFYDFGSLIPMDLDQVIEGTPLHAALTGIAPRRSAE